MNRRRHLVVLKCCIKTKRYCQLVEVYELMLQSHPPGCTPPSSTQNTLDLNRYLLNKVRFLTLILLVDLLSRQQGASAWLAGARFRLHTLLHTLLSLSRPQEIVKVQQMLNYWQHIQIYH